MLILFLDVPKLSEKILNTRTMQFLFIPLSFGMLLYLFWNCKLSSRYVILFHSVLLDVYSLKRVNQVSSYHFGFLFLLHRLNHFQKLF